MQSHKILTLLGSKQLQKSRVCKLQHIRCATAVAADKAVFDDATLANAKPFEEIPSLFMLPWLGTAWQVFPVIGRYDKRTPHLANMDKRRRMGDIFREKFGPINMVISFNPDDMQVLFQHEGKYPARGEFATLKAYRESRKQWYKTTGLLVLQGKDWHDLRTKTQKHLMKPKSIHAYLNPMQDVARDFLKKIRKTRDHNNEVPEFLDQVYKWALESIALVGLDVRLGCFDENLSPDSDGMRMINSVQNMFHLMHKLEGFAGNIEFWKLFPTPTWRKFTKSGDVFTELAFKYINRSLEELKKNADKEDKELTLLQTMLMSKELDVSDAVVMVADMLTAGIDTTSHSVGFLLYHLARNPDKQELLHQEITQLLPRKEDRITTEVFNKFKYLKACIKESQRLHPIVGGIARSIDHDIVFSGYRIPAGTLTVVGLQEIGQDEKYYSRPEEFLPERWLVKEDKFHSFSFLPFGVGTRSCVGRRLAELEIICLAAEILRNYRVEYHFEDIGIITRLINAPDKPLRFNFIERSTL